MLGSFGGIFWGISYGTQWMSPHGPSQAQLQLPAGCHSLQLARGPVLLFPVPSSLGAPAPALLFPILLRGHRVSPPTFPNRAGSVPPWPIRPPCGPHPKGPSLNRNRRLKGQGKKPGPANSQAPKPTPSRSRQARKARACSTRRQPTSTRYAVISAISSLGCKVSTNCHHIMTESPTC